MFLVLLDFLKTKINTLPVWHSKTPTRLILMVNWEKYNLPCSLFPKIVFNTRSKESIVTWSVLPVTHAPLQSLPVTISITPAKGLGCYKSCRNYFLIFILKLFAYFAGWACVKTCHLSETTLLLLHNFAYYATSCLNIW